MVVRSLTLSLFFEMDPNQKLRQHLTAGSTYSVGVSVTIGAGLSISKIAGLDLSASVSKTTTKSTSQGASVPCPKEPWEVFHARLLLDSEIIAAGALRGPFGG